MTTSTDSTTIPLKRCTKCGEEKPATLEYFQKRRKARLNLNAICKVCRSEYRKHYRAEHLDEERERSRKSREKNIEAGRERNRQYRAKHPEKIREASRRWQAKNLDKHAAKAARRRARKASLLATFTVEQERIALNFFNGCCAVCGRQLRDLFGTHTVHWDHWIPLSKGGGTTADNMIPLCGGIGGCNNSKHDKDPVTWLQDRYGKRKAKVILERIQAYFESVQ